MEDTVICHDRHSIVAAALFGMMSQRHFIEAWYVASRHFIEIRDGSVEVEEPGLEVSAQTSSP